MQEVEKIWMNGELMNWHDAKVHVLAHALHYGSSAFEGVRFYDTPKGPAIFRLEEHTTRLFESARAIEMEIPYSEEEINNAIVEVIKSNGTKSGYIRPIAFYGYGKMGLYPKGAPVDVVIAIWPWGSYLGADAVRVKTSSFVRIHPKSTIPTAKLGGHYINSIMASLEAHNEGYDEALLLDYEGNVAEGPGENIFFAKDNVLYTPKMKNILCGITRSSVMEVCKDQGIEVREEFFNIDTLKQSDEAFFTGTAAEITPISSIDDDKIGTGEVGPISAQIKEVYMDAVQGKNPKYEKWLTYVS